MKQITIAGNVGKNAELRTTPGGDSVAGFSVAVEMRAGKEKATMWFDVSIWGRRAEALAQYLTKGSKVCVSGDLGTREYEGKTYLTIRASEVTLMGGKRDDAGGERQDAPQEYGASITGLTQTRDMDDEIPF